MAKRSRREEIREIIQREGFTFPSRLGVQLGVSRQAAFKHLSNMVRDGELRRIAYGICVLREFENRELPKV